MAEKEILILDASVAVKWFSPEPLREQASAIRRDFVDGRVELEAPTLLPYEVANALRYNPRFGVEEVKAALKALNDMQLVLHPFEEQLIDAATELAFRFGVTVYDAAYVALAVMRRGVLYTADGEVVARVSSDNVRHLSEYER